MAVSRWPSGNDPIWRSVSRSLRALMSQARTSSALASSIDFSPVFQNLGHERGGNATETIELSPRLDQHILRDVQTAQAAMRALGAMHRRFVAVADNDHEVEVAAFVGSAPGV